MNTQRVTLVSLLALCLGGVAVAQEERTPTFSEIDTDENGQVTLIEAEQSEEVTRLFDALDTNKDGQLSIEEYSELDVVAENH